MVVFCKPLKMCLFYCIYSRKKARIVAEHQILLKLHPFLQYFFVNFCKPCTLNYWDLSALDIYNTKYYVHTGVHQVTYKLNQARPLTCLNNIKSYFLYIVNFMLKKNPRRSSIYVSIDYTCMKVFLPNSIHAQFEDPFLQLCL